MNTGTFSALIDALGTLAAVLAEVAYVILLVFLIYFCLTVLFKRSGVYRFDKPPVEQVKEGVKKFYHGFNCFVGDTVGLGKGERWYSRKNWLGYYVEHVFLLYWVLGTLMVVGFPLLAERAAGDYPSFAAGIFLWLNTNAVMDCISLLITKYSLERIMDATRALRQIQWLIFDFVAALGRRLIKSKPYSQ